MSEGIVHMALFDEGSIDHAAEAVDQLRKLGVTDKEMTVISGIPFSDKILGRPMSWTRVGLIGGVGALVGAVGAMALVFGTPLLYPLRVGNQPIIAAIPTSIVVVFELTMLGLLISTFIGVLVETITPSYGPKGYHPKVTDGKIGVLFACPREAVPAMRTTLAGLGAEIIERPEGDL